MNIPGGDYTGSQKSSLINPLENLEDENTRLEDNKDEHPEEEVKGED